MKSINYEYQEAIISREDFSNGENHSKSNQTSNGNGIFYMTYHDESVLDRTRIRLAEVKNKKIG